MDYWKECISEALDEAGIRATEGQVEEIALAVEGAHENYGMAHGHDVASASFESETERQLESLRMEKSEHEAWVASTEPCRRCFTTGWVKDGWGRDQTCASCDGKGRVRRAYR